MAATFLLLTVLVQASTAMTARSAASAAVAAAARRATLPGADVDAEAARLEDLLVTIVPGAGDVDVRIVSGPTGSTATARVVWIPPGPLLAPFTLVVEAEVPRAIPP